MNKSRHIVLGAAAAACLAVPATASVYISFQHESGLSAFAEFTLVDAFNMQIKLKNTSTGAPAGFGEQDQILSAVSWDFGQVGPWVFDPLMNGGNVKTGLDAQSMNFDIRNVGADEDVSGEYGYSNSNGTGLLQNFVSSAPAVSGITKFGGENLHGPEELFNAEGGLVSGNAPIPIVSAGVIERSIVINVQMDRPVADLSFLEANGTRVEFGNDAIFIDGVITNVPAPGALALLGLAGLAGRRRRRG